MFVPKSFAMGKKMNVDSIIPVISLLDWFLRCACLGVAEAAVHVNAGPCLLCNNGVCGRNSQVMQKGKP